ncbi:hypothetical protein [Paraburkholderia sp. C35]|uniref:hypothetical protein n=1 Tax=Paraburkholderia sp. C35 TaxID=2126993 RepID=UPI0013A5799D|nr:hypothetical protein [Paraburkholderia sp. C35]
MEELDVDLLGSIHAHMDERGSSSSAYVVPMESIFIQGARTQERCIIVAVPHVASKDVQIHNRRIYSDVRTTPDRKRRACLMLAGGAVALSEPAVTGAAPLQYKRLVVVWILADEVAISDYPYSDAVSNGLLRASLAADTSAHWNQRGTNLHAQVEPTVVEVFDIFDIDSRIPG